MFVCLPQADVDTAIAYPQGNQPPIWIPEFLFNPAFDNPMMMTVNGQTWPQKVSSSCSGVRQVARVVQKQVARVWGAGHHMYYGR